MSLCKYFIQEFKYGHAETKFNAWGLKQDKYLHATETAYISVIDIVHKICIQTHFILPKQWKETVFTFPTQNVQILA